MHRFFSIVIRIALVAAVFGLVRQVLLDRSPRQALRGQPVIGSLDTWPTVPRRPTDSLAQRPVDRPKTGRLTG
jgi:hypothetical protein